MNLPKPNETVFRLTRDTLVNEFQTALGKICFQYPNLNVSYSMFSDDIGEQMVTSLEESGALIPSKLIPFGAVDLSVLDDIKTELSQIMVNCEEVRKSVTDDAEEKYGELVTTLESVASYVSDAESEMSYIDDTLDINESDVEVRIDDLQILIDKLQYSINTNEEDKDDTTN